MSHVSLAFPGEPRAQTFPTNPSQSCTVPSTTFATWFQSGTPSLNGVVNPANSVGFFATSNCSFYQWAKQMFLWLTSPAPSIYGGGAFDGSAAASNAEIISIHNNIAGMMPSGDVRDNYYMAGATWTLGGQTPFPVFSNPTPGNVGNQVGTSQLSGSTMETYQQGTDTTSTGASNCFSCHSSPAANINSPIVIGDDNLSHIFGPLLNSSRPGRRMDRR